MSKWLKRYFRQLDHDEAAVNTFEVYSRILESFQGHIIASVNLLSIKDIDADFILDFIEALEDQYRERENNDTLFFSSNTKMLYIMVLKGFFSFIEEKAGYENDNTKFTFQNEFKHLTKKKSKKNAKRRKSAFKYLSYDQVTNLIDYLDLRIELRGSYYDYIYSFAIKMMLFGGLRVTEMLQLKLTDLVIGESDGNGDILKLKLTETKSQEEQFVPIRVEHISKELAYLTNVHKDNPKAHILSSKHSGNPLDRSNLYRKVNTIYKKAKVEDKKGLHILRHTAAMMLLDKVGDISLVKDLLRHTDISTTMIYVNRSTKQLSEKIV